MRKWLFVSAGVTCFALGAVGVFVPGLPTTIFVLTGSYLLARSSPGLDARLRRSALFAPYVKYLDPAVPMPRGAKIAALVSMWTTVSLSAAVLRLGGAGAIGPIALLAAGSLGTWMIVAFRSGLTK